ncbi:hypothetical protein BGX21_002467 [Mortierella sp. AD011]|nr:hypothetical protein BGX20_011458 [Mortierella sp. AD010]KAF9401182.1 hypothetical protein BGX21_002467 [Mortierella sp. AD011]
MAFEFFTSPKTAVGSTESQPSSPTPANLSSVLTTTATKRKSECITEMEVPDNESPQPIPLSFLNRSINTGDRSVPLQSSTSSKQRQRLLGNEDNCPQGQACPQAVHSTTSSGALTGDGVFSEYGVDTTPATDMSELKLIQAHLDSDMVEEDALIHRIQELSSLHGLRGQEQTHKQLLAAARAGKSVDYQRETRRFPVLPNEILIQVFEKLLSDQQTLRRAALVCLDWNLCATVFLYRYPCFASTLHWALFVQTLCRAKEARRPKTRRRRSIIQNLSHARRFGPHPPSQLVRAQIEVYGGRTQWPHSRLEYDLGEFVRGIDLSKKTATMDQLPSVVKPQELSISNKPSYPQTTSSSRSIMDMVSDKSLQTKKAFLGPKETNTYKQGSTELSFNRKTAYTPPKSSQLLNQSSSQSSNQKWSILWSMENQYRKSTGSSRSSAVSPLQSSSTNVPNIENLYSKWVQGTQENNSASRSSLPNPSGQAIAGSLIDDDAEEGGQDDSGDAPATSEHKTETKEIRYKKSITVTVSSIIQMARHCPKLVTLCLGSSMIPDTLYLETGDYLSTLQPGPRSGLTYVPVTTADGAKALGEYCPRLQKLWLAGCDWVTAAEVRNFTMHCKQLQTLDLRHCSKLDGRLAQLFVVNEEPGVAVKNVKSNEDCCGDSDSGDESPRRRLKRDSVNMTTSLGGSQTGTDGAAEMETLKVENRALLSSALASSSSQQTILGGQFPPISAKLDSKAMSSSPYSADSPSPAESSSISEVSGSIKYKAVRDWAMCDLVNAASNGRIGKSQEHQEQQQQGVASNDGQILGNHENIDYSDEDGNDNYLDDDEEDSAYL